MNFDLFFYLNLKKNIIENTSVSPSPSTKNIYLCLNSLLIMQ